VVTEKRFARPDDRRELLAELPADRMLRLRLEMLLADYDQMIAHEQRSEVELTRRARKVAMIRHLAELPGIAWIRAATFYALIDTPFRFRSKSALWRYMGIGLQRRSSGKGREQVRVPIECNRLLKNVMLGAARTVAAQHRDNPFTAQYRRCLEQGQTPPLARRTVARSLASVMWGMFKSNTMYRPDWVGIPSGQLGSIA
jgi:transposase